MKLGIVGSRGMVGQVLLERMKICGDFNHFETYFFSTSQQGELHPYTFIHNSSPSYLDAKSINDLSKMDIVLSTQGGDYTKEIYPKLMNSNFNGYWIDAASTLRLDNESTIVLDPINSLNIKEALKNDRKLFVGGNCTVSLLLMAFGGLFKANLIEWVSTQTYQAASGAGAKNMLELLEQMNYLTSNLEEFKVSDHILNIEKTMHDKSLHPLFPKANFGHPLALNLLAFIDSDLGNGQSKEEWKAEVEANKILASNETIHIDGNCVRVGSMRSHAQGVMIKLKDSQIPLSDIESIIKEGNEWVKYVPNNKEETLKYLNPHYTSGKLDIAVGRVRKLTMGNEYLNAFTCGDQLLWGAAEPLRRMLSLILDHKS